MREHQDENGSSTPEFVELQQVSYGLSFVTCLALMVVMLYAKCSGGCSKQYIVDSSEHVLLGSAFMMLQSIAFWLSAFADFDAMQMSQEMCVVQGSIMQFACTGVLGEIGCIAFLSYKSVTSQVGLKDLYAKWRTRCLLSVFGVALALTVIPLGIQLGSGETFLFYERQPVNVLCWMNDCTGGLIVFVLVLFTFTAVCCMVASARIIMVVVETFRNRNSKVCRPELAVLVFCWF